MLHLRSGEKKDTFVPSPVSSPISVFSLQWPDERSLAWKWNSNFIIKITMGKNYWVTSAKATCFFPLQWHQTKNEFLDSWRIRKKKAQDCDWKMSTWKNWAFFFRTKKKNLQMTETEDYRWSFSEKEKLYLKNRAESGRGACVSYA